MLYELLSALQIQGRGGTVADITMIIIIIVGIIFTYAI